MRHASMESKLTGNWRRHRIGRHSAFLGEGTRKSPALHQIVTEHLEGSSAVPYLAHMAEPDRLVILVNRGRPIGPHLMFSDDRGATWTDPRPMRGQATPDLGVGLACLGGGRLMLTVLGEVSRRFFSDDFGETWDRSAPMPPPGNGLVKDEWDPPFVDRDPGTGAVRRIISTAYQSATHFPPEYNPDWACLRISTDLGRTWSEDELVPQWRGINEVALARAANGDLIAACRTDWLEEHLYYQNVVIEADHYSGLGVSVSGDDGRTWSDVRILYRYGRHHPSMVVLPNDDVVMTYVVRKGYPKHPSGHDRYGVEAMVSHDHGRTWDPQPYLLHDWCANRTDAYAWWASSQCTSTVLLPDGDLLTCYSTGVLCPPDSDAPRRDVGLLRWSIDDESRRAADASRHVTTA